MTHTTPVIHSIYLLIHSLTKYLFGTFSVMGTMLGFVDKKDQQDGHNFYSHEAYGIAVN